MSLRRVKIVLLCEDSQHEAFIRRFLEPFRTHDEAVAIAVPKRNIETWIHYLNGKEVDEKAAYPKLGAERGCKPAVTNLVKLCRSTGLKSDAPPALAAACDEYTVRIRPII